MLPTDHVHVCWLIVQWADIIISLISFNQLKSNMETHYILCWRNWHFLKKTTRLQTVNVHSVGYFGWPRRPRNNFAFCFSLCNTYCKSFLSDIRAQNVVMVKVLVKLLYLSPVCYRNPNCILLPQVKQHKSVMANVARSEKFCYLKHSSLKFF